MATATSIAVGSGRAGETARRWASWCWHGGVRSLAVALSALAVLVGAVALALVLGALPVPAGAFSTEAGGGATPVGSTVRVAVISNGFHSDIALPADGATLGALGLDAAHYPVERPLVSWWAVGWGSREAYTSLVDVADLSPGLVARAVAFDRTVMHVAPIGPLEVPGGGAMEGVWFLDLPRERYDALLADIASWFASVEPEPGLTQGFADRFYDGRGRFTAWHGCNAWVGRRLRAAGVPVGTWTPAAPSLAYGLDRTGAAGSAAGSSGGPHAGGSHE